MFCFRYVTPVVHGRWYSCKDKALQSALNAGQAYRWAGEIHLRDYVRLEEQPARNCKKECE